MRIIGGRFKGRKLHTFSGSAIRPTSDRMREAIFNILSKQVQGAVVLDLFSGSGALGIEAMSRGARSVLFIDKDRRSISLIEKNIESCHLRNQTRVMRWDVANNLKCLKQLQACFTLVFMDPPYEQSLIQPTLTHLHESGALLPSASVVIEHSAHESVPREMLPFKFADERKYGKNLVTFLTYML
jgi:16S rRNA (guanine966-N2)-methyltransferase